MALFACQTFHVVGSLDVHSRYLLNEKWGNFNMHFPLYGPVPLLPG